MTHKTFSRRDFLRGAAVTTLGTLALAACAPVAPNPQSSGGSAPAVAPATITFVVDTINEGHVKVRDKWAADFGAANNVKIDHQPVPQDYTTKVQTLFAAGTPPDVYRYLQEVTPIIAAYEKNLHLQLDDYIARDNYDMDDFRPDAVNLYRWEGKTLALPRDYGNQNVFYNLTLLEAAGIEPPPVDWAETTWTFEKFLDVATQLTQREGDKTTQWGCLINRGQRPWASWVYSNGGALVHRDDKGVATACALADEAAVEALQFVQDLMHKHKVAPTPDAESELGGFQLFATGRVGMMINNPSAVNQFRTIEAFQWDVATLPLGKGERRGTGGGGTGWAGAQATQSADMVWKFIAYISSAQAEVDEVAVGATTPARVSVVTGQEFLNPDKPPKNASGFAQAQEYVVRDPVHLKWPEITQRIYNPKMDQLWSGAKDAATVAAEIKAEADPLFAS